MSAPQTPDPADLGPDEDDAAIDEALEALTSGMAMTATAEEDEELGEDVIGEADEDADEGDGVDMAGFTDDDAADDMLGALEVPAAADAPINFEEPGEEDMPEFEPEVAPMTAMPMAAPDVQPADDQERRLARLEDLASALISAENTRESGKVKRKVSAGATGAAAAGVIPVILQLAGVIDLDPELAATLTAGVAALASFVSGYLTPERQPALDPVVAHKVKTPRKPS
jgi:hypothetical protein